MPCVLLNIARGKLLPKAGRSPRQTCKPAEPVQGDETKKYDGNRGGARKTGIESALAAGRQYTLIAPRQAGHLTVVNANSGRRINMKSGAVPAVGLAGCAEAGRVASSLFLMEVSNVKSHALQPV
jgi:hypothetical protein